MRPQVPPGCLPGPFPTLTEGPGFTLFSHMCGKKPTLSGPAARSLPITSASVPLRRTCRLLFRTRGWKTACPRELSSGEEARPLSTAEVGAARTGRFLLLRQGRGRPWAPADSSFSPPLCFLHVYLGDVIRGELFLIQGTDLLFSLFL